MILFLFLLFAGEVEVEILTPSLPSIMDFFNISVSKAEFLVTINVLAHCLFCVPVGIFADKYNKKKLMLAGFAGIAAGSLICAFSQSYQIIIIGRILQGAALSVPAILCYPMFLDCIKGHKNELNIVGYFSTIFNLAVGIAPLIGGYLTMFYGWRSVFVFNAALCLLSLPIIILFVKNTTNNLANNKKDKKDIEGFSIKSYLPILKDQKQFALLLFANSAVYVPFVAIMPIFLHDAYSMQPSTAGIYTGLYAALWGLVSFFLGHLVKFFGEKRACLYGLVIIALSAVLLIILSLFCSKNFHTPSIVTLCFCLSVFGYVVPSNIFYMKCLDAMPLSKGKISSLNVISKWILVAIVNSAIGYFYNGSFASIGICLGIAMFITFVYGFRLYKEFFY